MPVALNQTVETYTANGVTPWYQINDSLGVRGIIKDTLGGASFALEQYLVDSDYPVTDGEGDDIVITGELDDVLDLRRGDIVRWNITGGSGMNVKVGFSGNVTEVGIA